VVQFKLHHCRVFFFLAKNHVLLALCTFDKKLEYGVIMSLGWFKRWRQEKADLEIQHLIEQLPKTRRAILLLLEGLDFAEEVWAKSYGYPGRTIEGTIARLPERVERSQEKIGVKGPYGINPYGEHPCR